MWSFRTFYLNSKFADLLIILTNEIYFAFISLIVVKLNSMLSVKAKRSHVSRQILCYLSRHKGPVAYQDIRDQLPVRAKGPVACQGKGTLKVSTV